MNKNPENKIKLSSNQGKSTNIRINPVIEAINTRKSAILLGLFVILFSQRQGLDLHQRSPAYEAGEILLLHPAK